ncbi:MAG: collagen-like protein [Mesorhizobium sp.]|nr:MAG: collagen-like protein [Mesorhizobium sp.]
MSYEAILEVPNVIVVPGPAGPQGTEGPQGDQGLQGIQGARGNGWIFGAGVPSPVLGIDGDSYVEQTTRKIYLKSNGAWADTGESLLTSDVAIEVECADESTPQLVQSGVRFGRFPYACTIQDVRLELVASQTSGPLFTVDVKLWDGAVWVSIFSTLPTIDNGELTSVSATTQSVISTSAAADDQRYRVDVTQIGSGDALGLKVKIYIDRVF